ncbi:MAG: 16S rRNA (cytosine(1402)-N(4))-methyltransferase RsmH [Chthoniobacterales bacterium]|nr:16S rRNA (cytosine(1402)-N(4))-methyltransferase RsmH [Chthoniobacterales bacterium]
MSSSDSANQPGPASLDHAWHEPVLRAEVLRLLDPRPGKLFLDGTLGGGGHSEALLAADSRVIGLDRDNDALHYAASRLAVSGERFRAVHGNFADAAENPAVRAAAPFDGALLDLGVSSFQLDSAARGFSFRHDGPLDMRMDAGAGETAADIVNTATEEELARIFRQYGEEPLSRRAARAVAAERVRLPFTRTGQLAALLEKVLPRRGRVHPATRVFQALRIAVNDELGALRRALETIPDLLRGGARFAVITFHSLEDRLVKSFFRSGSKEWLDRPEWPAPRRNPDHRFLDLTRKPLEAAAEEVKRNPRSRSARLRAVEMICLPQEVAA